MLEKIAAAHTAGKLTFYGAHAHLSDPVQFATMLAPLKKKRWFVYAKESFAGPKQVLAYLSRYTEMALCVLGYNLTRVINIVGVARMMEAVRA